MSSFGYTVACTFANWGQTNQKLMAEARVKSSLEDLLRDRTTREFWVQHWDALSVPLFMDLFNSEEDWYRRFDAVWYNSEDAEVASVGQVSYQVSFEERKMNRRDILYKYLGEDLAEDYIEEFSLDHGPEMMLARVYQMVHRVHNNR